MLWVDKYIHGLVEFRTWVYEPGRTYAEVQNVLGFDDIEMKLGGGNLKNVLQRRIESEL